MLTDGVENNFYTVTPEGKVYNDLGEEMRGFYTHDGYVRVKISKGRDKPKMFRVHRLVAENYIDNPLNYSTVNHLNRVRDDNHVSNLEWCSTAQNNAYKYLFARGNKAKPVYQYDLEGNFLREFSCPKEAFEILGIQAQNISKVARGIRSHAGGFYWKYQSPETIERLGE